MLVEDEDVTVVLEADADAGRESDVSLEAGTLATGLKIDAVIEADTELEVSAVPEALVITPMLVTIVVLVVGVIVGAEVPGVVLLKTPPNAAEENSISQICAQTVNEDTHIFEKKY